MASLANLCSWASLDRCGDNVNHSGGDQRFSLGFLSIECLNTFLVYPWVRRLCNSPSACNDPSIPPAMPAVRTTQSRIQVLRSSSPAPPCQILAPHAPSLPHPALHSGTHNHDGDLGSHLHIRSRRFRHSHGYTRYSRSDL